MAARRGDPVQIPIGLQRLGMNLVEAGNVVVPLQQRGGRPAALDGARVEIPHRIEHGMIVRIENVFLEFGMAGDMNLRDAVRRDVIQIVNGSKPWFCDET